MPPHGGGQADVDHVVKSDRVEVLPKDGQLMVSPLADHVRQAARGQARPESGCCSVGWRTGIGSEKTRPREWASVTRR